MTVITKPLCQDQKEEKLDKEVIVTPGGETIILPDDSTSVIIEALDNVGERRLTSDKNSSRGWLRVSQLFLLCAAIFSVSMGLTVAMHSYFSIGHRRQFYRGYCRVPYPSTLIDGLYDPAWPNFDQKPSRLGDSTLITGRSVGLGVGLNGDSTIVTGDVARDSDKPLRNVFRQYGKPEEMKKIMERLIQKIVSPQSKEKNKNIPSPVVDDGPVSEWISGQDRNAFPKVTMNEKQKLLPDGKFELDFDIDLDLEREELQMPELSQAKYLHDFKANITAIIDKVEKRCFVFPLNRHDISPPRTLYDIINGMTKGAFDINIEEIRQDMTVILPAITNVGEYGPVIKAECEGMKTFRLVPSVSSRRDTFLMKGKEIISRKESNEDLNEHRRFERSASNENLRQDIQYQEFAGKFIKYNIINLKEI